MIGIGIGVHGRKYGEVSSIVSAFVNAVIAAGGSLTALEISAITAYVSTAVSADGWWNNTHADYPMVGGTAASCSINLKDPGTFDITWINTIAGDFTANGWTPNGATSYGRTGLVDSIILLLNNVTLEYYSRDNIAEDSVDMGASVTIFQRTYYTIKWSDNNAYIDIYNGTTGRITQATGNTNAGLTVSRVANNDMRVFRNGIEYGSIVTGGGTQPSIEFYLGAGNLAGIANLFGTKETAGNLIGDGFTPVQVLAQYNARQQMNTTLGRQV